jgi:hypothetical protein
MREISESEWEELQELRKMKSKALEIARGPERSAYRIVAVGKRVFFLKVAASRRVAEPKPASPTKPDRPFFDGSHSTVPGHMGRLNWNDQVTHF